jgi:hypothetical protein
MRNLMSAALLVLLALPVLAFHEESRLMELVPGLNIITSFAHDYGERLDRVIFQDKEYKPGEATEKILPTLNWNNRPDKLELGVAWARVFALHGCEVLEKGHYLWKDDFQEPLAEILEDGTFRYRCCVAKMTGRNPGRIYFKRVEISPQAIMKVTPIGFPEPDRPSIQLP